MSVSYLQAKLVKKEKLEIEEHKIIGVILELRELVNKCDLNENEKLELFRLIDETKEVVKNNFAIQIFRAKHNTSPSGDNPTPSTGSSIIDTIGYQ